MSVDCSNALSRLSAKGSPSPGPVDEAVASQGGRVEPRVRNNVHAAMTDNVLRDGLSGKEQIVVQGAIARLLATTVQDCFVGRVLCALSYLSGLPAKRYSEVNLVPSLERLGPTACPAIISPS